jgi:hypothetical protein
MNWENLARQIVRAELVRRGLTYGGLAARLEDIGVDESERAIANKMSRGTFTFVFVLQVMKAIGVTSLNFEPATHSLPPRTRSATRRKRI